VGIKISAKSRVDDVIDQLFDNNFIVVDNGSMSREVSKALSGLRKDGRLMVGWDRELKKSILMLREKVLKKKRHKRGFGGSIFDIVF